MLNFIRSLFSLTLLIILQACTPLWGRSNEISLNMVRTKTPTPFLSIDIPKPRKLTSYATPSSVPSEMVLTIEQPLQVWTSLAVPPLLADLLKSNGFKMTNDQASANFHIIEQPLKDSKQTRWIYALVAPFPTITDEIKWQDFLSMWRGENSNSFKGVSIWIDSTTLEAITSILGPPEAGIVRISPSEDLIKSTWNERPSWAIVPFEDIEPRWKVLSVDGQSPIDKKFDEQKYPLQVIFGFKEMNLPSSTILPLSNRDPEKLTTLVMTGVTALVRATAGKMERNGFLYPGEGIRNWLVSADLTHISNEIPFSDNCPFPDPNQADLVFCSDPKYISLLEDMGTDIVELTGNHFQDWGTDATIKTIEMYKERGWLYFGGGLDLKDAQSAKLIISNGNIFAFIGCNPAGPAFDWATDSQPGAAPCNLPWMQSEVTRLRSEGYLPIVTFQYYESYSVQPGFEQLRDFQNIADAGAVIVNGSQAHLPQTMELRNGSFIHYGLGNLFFDQMDYPVIGTRREFIDRHIIYNGKYINTELLTAMLEDYSRPRPMTPEERDLFLNDIFSASGW